MAHSTLLYLIVEAVCYLVPDDDADAAVVQALDDGQELQKQVLRGGATGAQPEIGRTDGCMDGQSNL